MGKIATMWLRSNSAIRWLGGTNAPVRLLALGLVLSAGVAAQTPIPAGPVPDWRRVGNSAIELQLADLATGPIERVWYTPDGGSLLARTAYGRTYVTTDFDSWIPAADGVVPPAPPNGFAPALPEAGAILRNPSSPSPRVYAFGAFVYRSDDGGRHWENKTGFRGRSIVGSGLRDLAVSPVRENEITVATGAGVFRSMDGGTTWAGLNALLPNLPASRIRAIPEGSAGAKIELAGAVVLEWQPGERTAWRLAVATEATLELARRNALGEARGGIVTALAEREGYIYAGLSGRIAVSPDRGATWIETPAGGTVTAFWVDNVDPRLAIATLTGTADNRVWRTIDGGARWDPVTNDLPETSVNGVTADTASGVAYLATDAGVFMSRLPLRTLGAPPAWVRVGGLPEVPASDVRLSPGGVQLWAATEEFGLYAAVAPHRMNDPRVVSTADMIARAAAPGALLSVVGSRADSAYAGGAPVPVLGTTPTETQIQVPFEAGGSSVALTVNGDQGSRTLPAVPLQATAPAIITDWDGAPQLLDTDSSFRIDMMHPAHSGTRIQILATGLGRVRPDWPTGRPGPFDNVPTVVAPVTAYLNGEPVQVTRAVLASGYIGYYLVEIEVPAAIDYGALELYIEAGGQASNRVRVYIEP